MRTIQDAKILIVDDEGANISVLERLLGRNGFLRLRSTTDPREVAELIEEEAPDLILLDLMMPHLDGYGVMEHVRRWIGEGEFLPILVLTADSSDEARMRALAGGATDFLSKPFDAIEAMLRIKNLLRTRQLHVEQAQAGQILEGKVRARTKQLEDARNHLLDTIAQAAEFRDDETGRHTHRVGIMALLMAGHLGIDARLIDLIGRTAPLHDVGKIGIPDRILLKPGRLTPEEFDEIKKHTLIGATLLGGDDHELLETARIIAATHHERFDGNGYPKGLIGETIPIEGRIVSVVDVWDALIHERPYKKAWPEDRALAEIEANSGTQFDPRMVEAFVEMHMEGATQG